MPRFCVFPVSDLPRLFESGGLEIPAMGAVAWAVFALGALFAFLRLRRKGLRGLAALDLWLCATAVGLMAGRSAFVLQHQKSLFTSQPAMVQGAHLAKIGPVTLSLTVGTAAAVDTFQVAMTAGLDGIESFRAALMASGAPVHIDVFDGGTFQMRTQGQGSDVWMSLRGPEVCTALALPRDGQKISGVTRSLWDGLRLWEGGFDVLVAAYGALIGLFLGSRLGGIAWGTAVDAASPGLFLAAAAMHAALFFSGAQPGKGCPADFPLAVAYPPGSSIYQAELDAERILHGAAQSLPQHPVEAYRAAGYAFLVFLSLVLGMGRRSGIRGGILLILAFGIEFGVDFLRGDHMPRLANHISLEQVAWTGLFFVGILSLVTSKVDGPR